MQGTPPPPRSVAERFEIILESLCRAVAKRQKYGLAGPLTLLIWFYLKRKIRLFKSLAARAEAGTLAAPKPRARPPAPPDPAQMEPAQPAARMRKPRLPSGRAWLCVLVPYEAATYGSQLAHLMDDPAMIALLAASPAFARMLRPLFWATGAHPTAGRLPPLAPRKPRAPRPRRPRQKKVYWKCAKPPASGLIFYTK